MRFYKLAIIKAWFEEGYGLTHYIFKLIAVIGITSNELTATIWAIGIYTICCFILGIISYKIGFKEACFEVGNRYNLFQKEMRVAIK